MQFVQAKSNRECSEPCVRESSRLCVESGHDGTEIYLPIYPEAAPPSIQQDACRIGRALEKCHSRLYEPGVAESQATSDDFQQQPSSHVPSLRIFPDHRYHPAFTHHVHHPCRD